MNADEFARLWEARADGPEDGGAEDPTIARVLLIFRETLAAATQTACEALRDLGVDDPGRWLLRRRP